MDIENLVKMANDIGSFFGSEPDRELAVQGIYEHIQKFWDPRMRQAIVIHLERGGEGLNELTRAAVGHLEKPNLSI